MNNYKQTQLSHEQLQWIAEQNDIDRQETLIEAINALTQSNYALAQSNDDQTEALNTLNSKLICEFTGWNLTEALVNIVQTIKQQNKI